MASLTAFLDAFEGKRILVVGDVMLDSYIQGDVNRVSPEAPVPIVSFTNREERLGGAANVACNLLSLGAEPILCSVIGNDEEGLRLSKLAEELGISTQGLIKSDNRQTTVKIRIIGNNQQLLRIDKEQTDDIDTLAQNDLLSSIEALMSNSIIDALIFEDYNKGLLNAELIERLIALCKKYGIFTTVDPKKENFLSYRGVTLFKPNFKELKEGLGLNFSYKKGADFEQATKRLRELLDLKFLFVTLSEHGVYMLENESHHYVDAHRRAIRDVSGAGDTVISVATLGLASGMTGQQIAQIANVAGGLVCEKSGVVSINKDELLSELKRLGL